MWLRFLVLRAVWAQELGFGRLLAGAAETPVHVFVWDAHLRACAELLVGNWLENAPTCRRVFVVALVVSAVVLILALHWRAGDARSLVAEVLLRADIAVLAGAGP